MLTLKKGLLFQLDLSLYNDNAICFGYVTNIDDYKLEVFWTDLYNKHTYPLEQFDKSFTSPDVTSIFCEEAV